MKTWWHYYPMLMIAGLIPFAVGALPTVEIDGRYLGGGPIRQAAINWLASWLPSPASGELVQAFMNTNQWGEYWLFLPIALNLSLLIGWVTYGIGQAVISLNNWVSSQKYHSQRQAAKQ
ncbi:MAG: hypothetical protein R3208_14065 [Ketobacteraceae bacterium]|nr:hypothetical protein [Ketobacteraceae bacterium]